MNDTSYLELKSITDKLYKSLVIKNKDMGNIFRIFYKYGVKLRNKDGIIKQVNLSIPKLLNNGIVVGLRYIKKDGSKSEDLFLFQLGKEIQKGYKGKLEKLLHEYKGTHKLER